MSQKNDVIGLIYDAGSRGVCLADVPRDLSYTLRNRVSELRHDGYNIESERCTRHAHRGPILRYKLAPKGQLALL